MARTVLSPQLLSYTGLEATYSSANADGSQFLNDGTTGKELILHVKNGSGADVDVTIQTSAVLENRYAVADNVVTVPAGEDRFITQFTKSTYNQTGVDTVDGEANYVFVDYESVTSVTVALLKVPSN